MSWKKRLAELGITLPAVAAPAGAYLPAVRNGHFVYTSGQLPLVDGKLTIHGKVSDTAEGIVTVEAAKNAARICALNALAAIDDLIGIDHVEQIVKVTGFVASAPGFSQQPQVVNGASELFLEIFGEYGKHARSAVGVAELPRGTPVEVEVLATIKSI